MTREQVIWRPVFGEENCYDCKIDGVSIGGVALTYEADPPGKWSGVLVPGMWNARHRSQWGNGYMGSPPPMGPYASESSAKEALLMYHDIWTRSGK